jgi:predicted dinucleotide-binding enzyme
MHRIHLASSIAFISCQYDINTLHGEGNPEMTIAIIGSGNVGGALAQALQRSGHEVVFGVKNPDPEKPEQRAIADAASSAEVSILAVPFNAAPEVIESASGFADKIVIDATNPLQVGEGGLGLTLGFNSSGAEQIAAKAPKAHLFKTFNQTGFENMAHAGRFGSRPVMFVAGDNEAHKPTVLKLVADAGFEALDAGGLRAARLLEPFAMLWIELARNRGLGPDFAFTLQRKV